MGAWPIGKHAVASYHARLGAPCEQCSLAAVLGSMFGGLCVQDWAWGHLLQHQVGCFCVVFVCMVARCFGRVLTHFAALGCSLRCIEKLHYYTLFGCGLRLRSTSLQALACSHVCSSGRVCMCVCVPTNTIFHRGGFCSGRRALVRPMCPLAVCCGGMGSGFCSQCGASYNMAHSSGDSGAFRGRECSPLLSPCPLGPPPASPHSFGYRWSVRQGDFARVVCLLRLGMCLLASVYGCQVADGACRFLSKRGQGATQHSLAAWLGSNTQLF